MTTITGLTAERMLEIEAGSIVDGVVVNGNLILTKNDGSTINAGPVVGPTGPTGPTGSSGGFIPGEIRLWPSTTLPLLATYGHWVWADGASYVTSQHPVAAGHIASAWRTFGGAADPGGSNFRVPDFRGLVPAGLDQMPGGSRANRMTRAIAITIAGKTGEETHVLTVPEMPAHTHSGLVISSGASGPPGGYDGTQTAAMGSTGGGGAHENVQPTVMVPFIVYLDG